MTHKLRLVTINGPMGSGKSWVLHKVMSRLARNNRFIEVKIQEPIEQIARASVQDFSTPYDEFKKTTYYGLTGREWMIRASELQLKGVDPSLPAMLLVRQMRNHYASLTHAYPPPIFIMDTCGFAYELLHWRAQDGIDVLAGSIDPPDNVPPGEQYIGDSRHNLSHMCSVVGKDSTELAEKLITALQRRNWAV